MSTTAMRTPMLAGERCVCAHWSRMVDGMGGGGLSRFGCGVFVSVSVQNEDGCRDAKTDAKQGSFEA